MASLRAPRRGKGRPRTKSDRAMAEEAYASKVDRKLLRDRGIEEVMPEKSDHIANWKRLGAKGGRPPTFDKEAYKRRHIIERRFHTFKDWRGIASRFDKLTPTYRVGVILRAVTTCLTLLGNTPESTVDRRPPVRSFITPADSVSPFSGDGPCLQIGVERLVTSPLLQE